jgi:hypothetical protein
VVQPGPADPRHPALSAPDWTGIFGDEAAAALAALLRSLGFEKVTVVFEQPPAT